MPDLYVVTDGVEPVRVTDVYGLAIEAVSGLAAGRIFRVAVPGSPIGMCSGFVDVTEDEPVPDPGPQPGSGGGAPGEAPGPTSGAPMPAVEPAPVSLATSFVAETPVAPRLPARPTARKSPARGKK